jgi:hypothetical protein
MTGRTSYQLLGPINNGVGYNDSNDYPGNTLQARYNEIGLGGFTPTVSSTGQNPGYIDIPSSQFSLFASPSLVQANGTITSSGSAYAALPFYTGTSKIFGLTLNNPVISAGRAPRTVDVSSTSSWDGYFSIPPGTNDTNRHHVLNPGSGGLGLNVVLRYKDYSGNWEVYSAFASNEADPNGQIGGNYDLYGICQPTLQATSLDGVYMDIFSIDCFPCYSQTTVTGSTWAIPDTKGQSNLAVLDPANGSIPYGNIFYVMKGDPRTARFGLAASFNGSTLSNSIKHPTTVDDLIVSPKGYGFPMYTWLPSTDSYNVSTFNPGNPGGYYPAMWAQNVAADGPGTYYFDNSPSGALRSGKVRPGDDYFNGMSGLPGTTGTTGTNNIYLSPDSQPVILHRPFRSVGELGYVFRDMPMKSLDMCSSLSVDAALLDFFTVDPSVTPMVAGKVDINTRQKLVLQSILNGSFRKEDPSANISMGPIAAATIAGNIVAGTGSNALQNKANLVTSQTLTLTSGTYSDVVDTGTNSVFPSIKTQREAPIRALADAANTRTWNLLIDVIAQTGQYASGASGLSQFVVTGERRYWLHVAIDRYTGAVIDEQLEPVYE